MENSRTTLRKWMIAIQLVSLESSITAVRLASIISVTYKTAWRMLHKIRLAISNWESSIPLSGKVKVGYEYYGRFHSVRKPRKLPLIIGISLKNEASSADEQPHRVKIKLVSHSELQRPQPAGSNPEFGNPPPRPGFSRLQRIPPLTARLGNALPRLYCHAKQWIDRTFHGLGTRYAQLYWDEFCYRRNLSFANSPVLPHLTRLCVAP